VLGYARSALRATIFSGALSVAIRSIVMDNYSPVPRLESVSRPICSAGSCAGYSELPKERHGSLLKILPRARARVRTCVRVCCVYMCVCTFFFVCRFVSFLFLFFFLKLQQKFTYELVILESVTLLVPQSSFSQINRIFHVVGCFLPRPIIR